MKTINYVTVEKRTNYKDSLDSFFKEQLGQFEDFAIAHATLIDYVKIKHYITDDVYLPNEFEMFNGQHICIENVRYLLVVDSINITNEIKEFYVSNQPETLETFDFMEKLNGIFS